MPKTSALIIETKKNLLAPYLYLPQTYTITRTNSLQTAFEFLLDSPPQLVLLSVNFPRLKLLDFLVELKCISRYKLIPLIFVVNFSDHLSFIPGTNWGGKLGLLHNLSSAKEVKTTLQRVMAKN